MTALDAIVLDLDDTLYDTTGLLLPWADRRAAAAMRAAGLPFEEDEVLRRIRSLRAGGSVDVFAEIARAGGAPAACAAAGEAAWLVFDPPPMRIDDDVESALDELAALAPLALLTLGDPGTQRRKVERLGIAGRFAECGYVDIRDGRGKSGALGAMLSERGWSPARTVMCGDRPDGDVLAGNRNGCLTVLVRRAGTEFASVATDSPELTPWRTIGHVRELAALLRG